MLMPDYSPADIRVEIGEPWAKTWEIARRAFLGCIGPDGSSFLSAPDFPAPTPTSDDSPPQSQLFHASYLVVWLGEQSSRH
jgi:hypothetical protein